MVCPVCSSPLANANSCPKCGHASGGILPRPAGSTIRSRYTRIHILVHILWLALPLYFYGRLLNSDAYRASLALARSSPDLQRVLGTGIRAGWPVGSALQQYGEDFAEWSVTLSGSAGSGRFYGVANHVGGEWEFARLAFVPARGGTTINLTPKPNRLYLPPAGLKKIYLIPLSLGPEQPLNWAPAYYKAKLGADVEILPPVALTSSEEDERRFLRAYQRSELAGKRFQAEIDVDGFDVTGPLNSWRVRWEGVRLKGEDERVFVLSSGGTLFMFGKKYLSNEQQDELRRLSGLAGSSGAAPGKMELSA